MFDTVAWWYRTDPCSTSAPVSVLGPWLLPPALTDLLHGITMTLCTTRPGLGFFLITSGMLVWGILACRMCADSMCAEAARKARLPHLRHRSVALVWKGTGELPHFSACLSAPQSLPKPLLPFHPLEKDLYPWHAACPALGYFIAPAGPYLARTRRIFREQVCRRQRGWVSAGV